MHPDDAPFGRDLVRSVDRELGLAGDPAKVGTGLEVRLKQLRNAGSKAGAPGLERGARAHERRCTLTRGAQPTPGATSIGTWPKPVTQRALQRIEAVAKERPDAHIIVTSAECNGCFVIRRALPKPPTDVPLPNHASLLDALPQQVRHAALGPPQSASPIILYDMPGADVARFHQTLAGKAKAAAGAGGKPPGGGRTLESLVDGPEPGRPYRSVQPKVAFIEGPSSRVAGKPIQRIRIEGPQSELMLAIKPQWHAADIRFPRTDSAAEHIVEVRVPVTFESGAPKSMLIKVFSAFRDKLSRARAKGDRRRSHQSFRGSVLARRARGRGTVQDENDQ